MSDDPDGQRSVLDIAQEITSGERRRDYDNASKNHERIAKFWNAYIESRPDPVAPLTPLDAAMMMILLKVARNVFSPKKDNIVDMAGYSKCAAQILRYEPE